MFSRTLQRKTSSIFASIASLPPTFLLPLRVRLSTTTTSTDPNPPTTSFRSTTLPPPKAQLSSPRQQPLPSSPATPLTDQETPSSLSLLPLLAAQTPHYIIAHLHARPYLLTLGDTLRLPFHMHHAPPGTILRLTRASALGSRDYTFRGKPWVEEKYFVCRMRVIGVEGEPMRVIKKTVRRRRKVKTIKSKMRFTVLRCLELTILNGEEGKDDQGQWVREGGEGIKSE